MLYLQYQLPIFVLALIANLALLTVVLQYAPKDRTRIFFSMFVLAQMLWITTNYFAFSVPADYFLFVARLTMFFATWHALMFFLFVENFLRQEPANIQKVLIPVSVFGALVAILTFTPLVFSDLGPDNNPQPGLFIGLFGAFVAFCILGAFYRMFSRYKHSTGEEKTQWKFLIWGFILTFILVLFLSFINFVVLKNISGVQFGHLYTLPFIIFTSYAMVKHKLLNVKAVLAEIMVVVLISIIFIQLINSSTVSQFVISGLVLVGALIGGVLLIKGVEKEVQQRRQLEILDKQLAAANEQLKALDKARSEFITIASHQLRTPPATIKWYLSALLDGDYGKFKKDQVEILEKTNRTNNSLISLIDDMLNVSRIERGKMEFMFEPVNMLDLAKITFEQLEPMAMEKHLELTFKAPKGRSPEIMADKEKIRQVMNNMIDNSIKYTKQGGVSVVMDWSDDEIKFSVIDTGKGFDAQEHGEIFEKFKRGKESSKQSAGLGLGLYVAKVIVEQHKGKIWAKSKGPGLGSTFAFSLPIRNGLTKTTLVDLAKP